MKSFTDIEQSKKLAKILPFKSADMAYIPSAEDDEGNTLYTAEYKSEIVIDEDDKDIINCWSLAALLGLMPITCILSISNGHYRIASNETNTFFHNNPIDACVEMIVKLHELKML